MSNIPYSAPAPRRLRHVDLAVLAGLFHRYLGHFVEVVTWDEPPRGPRLAAEYHVGRLVAGRGGAYRWFCGWVDLWTGHAVLRTRTLAQIVRAWWKNPEALGEVSGREQAMPSASAEQALKDEVLV